jgi:hypothetical protein
VLHYFWVNQTRFAPFAVAGYTRNHPVLSSTPLQWLFIIMKGLDFHIGGGMTQNFRCALGQRPISGTSFVFALPISIPQASEPTHAADAHYRLVPARI